MLKGDCFVYDYKQYIISWVLVPMLEAYLHIKGRVRRKYSQDNQKISFNFHYVNIVISNYVLNTVCKYAQATLQLHKLNSC